MKPLDLSRSDDNMHAFLKARASLDGSDTVTWFTGDVHIFAPGGAISHVFAFEGYNVARAVEVEGGYDLLTREAAFYRDPATRDVLDRWTNPITGAEVDVVHVWNDPVNQQFRLDGPRGPWWVPVTGVGDDLTFKLEVYLAYPSPLPRARFPEHSQADLYQAAELFQFSCSRRDLENDALSSVRCGIAWTRVAPWLPFMGMGDRPGNLVYHCSGAKLPGGYAALPDWMRARVESTDPRFRAAPREFTQPNETSWTYFRKLAEAAAR